MPQIPTLSERNLHSARLQPSVELNLLQITLQADILGPVSRVPDWDFCWRLTVF